MSFIRELCFWIQVIKFCTTLQALPVGSLISPSMIPCLKTSTPPSAWPNLAHGFQGAHSLSVIPPNHPSWQLLLFASCRELYERVHGAYQRPLWSKGGRFPAGRWQLAQHDDPSWARCWLLREGEQSQARAGAGCRWNHGKEPRELIGVGVQHGIVPTFKLKPSTVASCWQVGKALGPNCCSIQLPHQCALLNSQELPWRHPMPGSFDHLPT